jgi:hypothetical protein
MQEVSCPTNRSCAGGPCAVALARLHLPGVNQRVGSRPTKCLANLMRALMAPFASYRPELHYMRGPGPMWHAKNSAEPYPTALQAGQGLRRPPEPKFCNWQEDRHELKPASPRGSQAVLSIPLASPFCGRTSRSTAPRR